MKVKEALKKYISEKTSKGEVIHLTKIKGRVGKIEMTIGSGKGSGTNYRYAIWEYTKTCRCGQVVRTSDNPYRLAEYLIELCGREHLKQNLPLWRYH
jgi:hypothetical protein